MEIVTAFGIIPAGENWVLEENNKVEITDREDNLEDFSIGTFSSLERARLEVYAFLESYKIGDEQQLEDIGQNAPVIRVTYWKTTLDAGGALGELLETEEFDYE